MPLKVKIQIAITIVIGLAILYLLWTLHWALGLLFLLAAILYAEMINPRWNFFGPAVLDVPAQNSNGKKNIAITFDDGPSKWTPEILEILKSENVKATFFLLGRHIDQNPEIAKKIAEDGHAIGLHGYSHQKLHLKGPDFIRMELKSCEDALKKYGIDHQRILRFPHGFKNFFAVKIAHELKIKVCSWTIGLWDSKNPGVEEIIERSKKLKSGDILLLHDGDGNGNRPRDQTVAALKPIIQNLKNQNFEFQVLS